MDNAKCDKIKKEISKTLLCLGHAILPTQSMYSTEGN